MKSMFASATLKLTASYLGILMLFSLLFSLIIYQVSHSEISTRLSLFESRVSDTGLADPTTSDGTFDAFRKHQQRESDLSLLVGLIYTNLIVFIIGGAGSYVLARRTLKPIEASHEAQSRFAADASHELRTPLAIMKSELEVALRDTKLTKGDMRGLLESNLEEVNRLSELSRTLLQLTKDDESLEVKPVVLGTVVERAIKAEGVQSKRIEHGGKLSRRKIIGNDASLIELFMILFDNALRYSPDDSTVSVAMHEQDGTVSVVITNTGEGIATKDLPHVFDRFFRGDRSRASHGYGLGLSLAKRIADRHDAQIVIASTPGISTTATVSFITA